MGTEIQLDVGGLCLDWSKNNSGTDHGVLFQKRHAKKVTCKQLDYDYPGLDSNFIESMERAFVAKLKEVVPRISLLGFTLANAKREYDDYVAEWVGMQSRIRDDSATLDLDVLSFECFCDFVKDYPLCNLDDKYHDFKERAAVKGRFAEDKRIEKLPVNSFDTSMAYSELTFFGHLIGFLHPYTILCILGGCQLNLEAELVWNYGPVVENGWASEEDFCPGARRTQAFLVATEGSSDVHVIKHAFKLLKPEIEDFFYFIDVQDSHPFSGTGNLTKFAYGLLKIDIQNNVIFVFDNDAEGYEACLRVSKMGLLPNMRVALLPCLDEFKSFKTYGPDGEMLSDINNRAAAIECYLDLEFGSHPPPRVTWTGYKKEVDSYHGSLDFKESYVKAFLRQTPESLAENGYRTEKIMRVLDLLVEKCFYQGKCSIDPARE